MKKFIVRNLTNHDDRREKTITLTSDYNKDDIYAALVDAEVFPCTIDPEHLIIAQH